MHATPYYPIKKSNKHYLNSNNITKQSDPVEEKKFLPLEKCFLSEYDQDISANYEVFPYVTENHMDTSKPIVETYTNTSLSSAHDVLPNEYLTPVHWQPSASHDTDGLTDTLGYCDSTYIPSYASVTINPDIANEYLTPVHWQPSASHDTDGLTDTLGYCDSTYIPSYASVTINPDLARKNGILRTYNDRYKYIDEDGYIIGNTSDNFAPNLSAPFTSEEDETYVIDSLSPENSSSATYQPLVYNEKDETYVIDSLSPEDSSSATYQPLVYNEKDETYVIDSLSPEDSSSATYLTLTSKTDPVAHEDTSSGIYDTISWSKEDDQRSLEEFSDKEQTEEFPTTFRNYGHKIHDINKPLHDAVTHKTLFCKARPNILIPEPNEPIQSSYKDLDHDPEVYNDNIMELTDNSANGKSPPPIPPRTPRAEPLFSRTVSESAIASYPSENNQNYTHEDHYISKKNRSYSVKNAPPYSSLKSRSIEDNISCLSYKPLVDEGINSEKYNHIYDYIDDSIGEVCAL